MRVRMTDSVAGTRADGSEYVHSAGEEYDLPNAEAKDYLERQDPCAVPVAVIPSGRKGSRDRGVETR